MLVSDFKYAYALQEETANFYFFKVFYTIRFFEVCDFFKVLFSFNSLNMLLNI